LEGGGAYNENVPKFKLKIRRLKKLDNSNHFGKEVKLALLSNSFYMLEEFLQAQSVQ